MRDGKIIYEIDDGGQSVKREVGYLFRWVSGYQVGWFGIRKWGCAWRIDHLPTGLRLPHDFDVIDKAIEVCLELTAGRLAWSFTRIPEETNRAWWRKYQRQYDRITGSLKAPIPEDQPDE